MQWSDWSSDVCSPIYTMALKKVLQAPKALWKSTKATTSTSTTKELPKRLQQILNKFKTIDQVQFDPFQPKAYTNARANLPLSFLLQPRPLDYFSLFFTADL